LDLAYPRIQDPETPLLNTAMLTAPPTKLASSGRETTSSAETAASEGGQVGGTSTLWKGPNIASIPYFDTPSEAFSLPVLLKVGDNISTDEILPAGARVLPFRSNIPKISEFVFEGIDQTYRRRAEESRGNGGHIIIGGHNYGQGSSREHAALAPRYLGLRVVIAKTFARIHWQNLVNFGILPLVFQPEESYADVDQGDVLSIEDVSRQVRGGSTVAVRCPRRSITFRTRHSLSARQIDVLLAGGLINWVSHGVRRPD
jgi:aconitate hydratase